ncbi:MAG: S-layer homology domain-containing protein [Clostridia bacterium]|nr:S-layer homology domain-containing protein [Clostridia bacterium]
MKFSITKLILVLTILLACSTKLSYAHGLMYETKSIGQNKVRITLKWSSPSEAKGIKIAYYHLRNAKALTIGYEIDNKAPTTAYMDYDMASAIPPLRIVLAKVNDVAALPFKDIKSTEAEEYIRHLHDAGIIGGDSKGNFNPNKPISRAEFAVIMVNALKLNGNTDNIKEFKDANNHWGKKYILLAVKHGLMGGYNDNTFKPNNSITVAEVSTVLSNAFTFKTTNNGIYSKLKPNMWYSRYVKKMFDVGILKTADSIYNKFDERSKITRADCAMMISRALSTY